MELLLCMRLTKALVALRSDLRHARLHRHSRVELLSLFDHSHHYGTVCLCPSSSSLLLSQGTFGDTGRDEINQESACSSIPYML